MTQITSAVNDDGYRSSADLVHCQRQDEAQTLAFADSATSGARVFICHVYEQGGRTHLVFSLPCSLLIELAKLQSAEAKKNKSNADEVMNRPLIPQHVNEIAKYLLETDQYILPPFIFNSNTPIKVFTYGAGPVKFGYAVMPIDVELYVTDGQHRLKAIEKVLPEKPDLRNDSVTVLVVQEADMDQIHQDFADCAKNKPIPPALLAAFDVTDPLAKLTRTITKDLVIFNGRIDKISRTIGKDTKYMFTMSQLRIGVAEFLFGSSRKPVIESHFRQSKSEFLLMLERLKIFYTEFAKNNDTWRLLLQPASQTVNLNLYDLRQQRVDFNTVGFQVLSRIGHLIFFGQEFTDLQREALIKALAGLDYTRDSALWLNSIVIDDAGAKKIVTQTTAVDKAFKIARDAVQEKTGIVLI